MAALDNQPYIVKFQEGLQKIGQLNAAIEKNVQDKQAFSQTIITRLGQINEKIKALAGQIQALRGQVDNLNTQVSSNTSGIQDKDRQVQALQQQLTQVSNEKNTLTQQLTDLNRKGLEDQGKSQQKINTLEEQLRALTTTSDANKAQLEALQKEAADRGDQSATHATQLQALTTQHTKALQDQQAANDQRIAEVTAQIAAKDAEIVAFNEKIRNATEILTTQLNEAKAAQAATVAQIAALNQQIEQLTATNAALVQRIIAATQAIFAATQNLERLTDDAANAKNIDDVNKVFAEIEQSIDAIHRAVSQQQPAAGNNQQQQQPLSDDTPIPVPGTNPPIPLKTLKRALREKTNLPKYKVAFDAINNAPTIQKVLDLLRANGITFQNNNLQGGKTRKLRRTSNKNKSKGKSKKQKGGFVYKLHSKRRSMSSSLKSSRSSK